MFSELFIFLRKGRVTAAGWKELLLSEDQQYFTARLKIFSRMVTTTARVYFL